MSGPIYNLMMRTLKPWVVRKLARRAVQEPIYGQQVSERWGHYEHPAQAMDIWLHAVSLGEARAAQALVRRLRQQLPQARWVFTTGTATGHAELASVVQPGDVLVWQPWDTPEAVTAFFQHFQPRLGLVMETEIWPNWVAQAQRRQLPLVVINGRLSARSLDKARRLSFWSRPAYAGLTRVLAQTADDAQRFREAGASDVVVTGNLKFDAEVNPSQWALGQAVRAQRQRPVVMLASTREGEEQAWLQALREWDGPALEVQWLVVPRHPQRFDEVARLIEAQGLHCHRRSAAPSAQAWAEGWNSGVGLGDSLGEMAMYYGQADWALLGGSFEPLGGQNLIEACACECPLLVGPHTFNFAQATEWAIAAGAAERVLDWRQALARTQQWLADPKGVVQRRAQALAFAQAHQGALAATSDAVMALWAERVAKP